MSEFKITEEEKSFLAAQDAERAKLNTALAALIVLVGEGHLTGHNDGAVSSPMYFKPSPAIVAAVREAGLQSAFERAAREHWNEKAEA